MIVVIPTHQGDFSRAISLLRWIRDLGGCETFNCLIVADAGLQWNSAISLLEEAQKVFRSAELITSDISVQGWPQGPNSLWACAADHCRRINVPFLWLEPDAIPLKAGWLTAINEAYAKCGKGFMGRMYACDNPGLPKKLMSGIGVYPANSVDIIGEFAVGKLAWDVGAASVILPLAANTPLIQHFWGTVNMAPTFAEKKTASSSINTFTLANIQPEAVIFHRNNDGTLVRILRRKSGLNIKEERPLLIVIPACNKDVELATKNVRWMVELGGCPEHECVLALDSDTVTRHKAPLEVAANDCFGSVHSVRYRCGSIKSWPEGANVAFRSAANYLRDWDTPWLWLEADATPLREQWHVILENVYNSCGKLFMGPIVPHRGHCNGVAIYPPRTVDYIPNALASNLPKEIAWDYAMKEEMIDLCFDAGGFIQHVWGIINATPNPIEGDAPSFGTIEHVEKWVNPNAALFHRCKDGSLIDRLREIRKAKVST